VRILVLSTAIPFPPVGGGKARTYHLLRALARSHELTLAGFTYGEEPGLAPYPARVVPVPWEAPPLYRQMTDSDAVAARRAAELLGRESNEPWSVSWAASDAMDASVRWLAQDTFDLVLLEGTPMARFLPALPPDTPRVLDFMDVYTRMAVREAQGEDAAEDRLREAERMRRFERQAAMQCDRCLTVSDQEAAAARELLGVNHVEVVPNGVDTAFFTPAADEPEGASLLFTGSMSYRPNSEAVRHFARSIWPLILREVPEATLHVVGTDPPQDVIALNCGNVVVHGFVPDMRPHYRSAAVVVAPLLRGGGTKLKVLEAAASGKAIVTTSVGVEGLPFRDGDDLIVADSDADFTRAVVDLVKDGERRRRLGGQARRVSLHHDWKRIGERICRIVEAVFSERAAAIRSGSRG